MNVELREYEVYENDDGDQECRVHFRTEHYQVTVVNTFLNEPDDVPRLLGNIQAAIKEAQEGEQEYLEGQAQPVQ